jgi:transcriptional regulator with XRE-family HTH domain
MSMNGPSAASGADEPAALSLRGWRTYRLLTIRELAKLARVAPSTSYLAEHGRGVPALRSIRKLAEALSVAPEQVTEFQRALDAASGRRPADG